MPLETIDPDPNPHVGEFVAQVGLLFDPDDPGTFWKCEDAFARLAASSAVSDAAEQAVRRMLAAPLDAPSRWAVQRLILIRSLDYSLVAIWAAQSPASNDYALVTQGGHAFIRSCSSRPFSVRFFALGTVDFARFDPNVRLEPSHEVSLRPGEILAVDGGKWVIQLEYRADVCVLAFVSRPLWQHLWSFDARTLRPWHIGHSELPVSQLRAVIQIFRELGYAPSRAIVQELTHHPVHDVRWEAVKTLASLDAAAGVAALHDAADDPHPHVRAAARKSLAMIGADPRPVTEAA